MLQSALVVKVFVSTSSLKVCMFLLKFLGAQSDSLKSCAQSSIDEKHERAAADGDLSLPLTSLNNSAKVVPQDCEHEMNTLNPKRNSLSLELSDEDKNKPHLHAKENKEAEKSSLRGEEEHRQLQLVEGKKDPPSKPFVQVQLSNGVDSAGTSTAAASDSASQRIVRSLSSDEHKQVGEDARDEIQMSECKDKTELLSAEPSTAPSHEGQNEMQAVASASLDNAKVMFDEVGDPDFELVEADDAEGFPAPSPLSFQNKSS